MSKDKAELISQRKTRVSNGSTTQKSQAVSRTKSDEKVKKTRELSTDRSNIKQNVVAKSMNSVRKTESVNSKANTSVKSRTTARALTERSSVNKSVTKVNTVEKKATSSTPRTSVSKPATKPMKALKTNSSSSTVSSASKSNTSISSRGTKTSLKDTSNNRITKEPYFPKKYPFSSRLHENEEKASNHTAERKRTAEKPTQVTKRSRTKQDDKVKLSRERTMTRILSPSEIKVVKDIVQKTKSNEVATAEDERPRTATIRKHDEHDNNVYYLPIEVKSHESDDVPSEENDDYEDDFESYESDFEAYSSSSSSSGSVSIATDSSSSESSGTETFAELTKKRTSSAGNEEERKLDSGNYDLPDVKHKQILDKIKEAIEKENSDLTKQIHKADAVSNLASLSDEGFEDGSKYSLSNNGFINFVDAQRKQQQKKINLKSRQRGDDLMNMIRLNTTTFSLFDMKAISYDEFMQSYGRTGAVQVSAQTGDDDVDEDVQTDNIQMVNKSTQYPVRFSKTEESLLRTDEQTEGQNHHVQSNTNRLNKFMQRTGHLVLHILGQQKNATQQQQVNNSERNLPISNGYLKVNMDATPFLKKRAVTSMCFSDHGTLLTVHASNIQVYMNENEQLLARSTVCIWNLQDAMQSPQQILASAGEVVAACCDTSHGQLVFAGIDDGSISVWDLREPAEAHRGVYDEATDQLVEMRSPTYTAVATTDAQPSTSRIIAIQSFHTERPQQTHNIDHLHSVSGAQVCTLDETGTVIIWSVIQRQSAPDDGLGPWGCVVLQQGLTVSLQQLNPDLKELQCYGLQAAANHIFVASNYGVLHCLASGMKPKPKAYASSERGAVRCVEVCPFSAVHFLSGCEDGNLRLHSRFYEKPLMTLCGEGGGAQAVAWSARRPCAFLVLDSASRVHVWDLSASDMYPIYTVPYREPLTDIKLSPDHLAIASAAGDVYLHTLNKEFARPTPQQYQTELKIFLNYANRL